MSAFTDKLVKKYGEDFFKEEVRCDFLVTTERKKLWAVLLDLYEQFSSVCEKYNLKYYLCSGSLLGAVRHGGFIPWDDDFDVVMPREDYEKLIVLGNEFEYPYFLQTPYTDKNYAASFIKLRNSETTCLSTNWIREKDNVNMGISMDIFLLDEASGMKEAIDIREQMYPLIMKCSAYMKHNSLCLSEKDKQIVSDYYEPSLTPIELYETIQKCATGGRIRDKADYLTRHTVTVRDVDKGVWPKELFQSTRMVQFEGIWAKIPNGAEKILEIQYGDYMKFPPVKERGAWHGTAVFDADVPYKEKLKEWIEENL